MILRKLAYKRACFLAVLMLATNAWNLHVYEPTAKGRLLAELRD